MKMTEKSPGRNRFMTVCLLAVLLPDSSVSQLLTTRDYLGWSAPAADHRIPYGPGPLQFGDLRLPAGPAPHPVVISIHGGCWSSQFDLEPVGPLMEALRQNGFATWNLEYRRVGDEGGGWPGTFDDIAAGVDHLVDLAADYPLDLDRVVLLGHSAGGHLALWSAARSNLPPGHRWSAATRPDISGVVSLAGVVNLAEALGEGICGTIVRDLMGGNPEAVPERYQDGSPSNRLPLRTPQTLISGVEDGIVPMETADLYAEAAGLLGDDVEFVPVAGAGHFELVYPESHAWPLVLAAVRKYAGR